MSYAPIALFTYSRADHTRQAVESLLRNKEAADSDLFIFSDGPKTENKREAVEENRKYIHTISGFKSIHIVEHEKNQGLANSLIAGITEVVNKYGKVIVVEDDLVLSPYFLQFMNEALDKYENEERVGAISGYCPVTDTRLPETYFLRYFNCWGWATWKRAWDLFNPDARNLLRKIRWKKNKFDLDGARGHYGMLYCQKAGLIDSWFIRFYASLFLANKLTLYPGLALASNNGFDGSGTHCKKTNTQIVLSEEVIEISNIPIEESPVAYQVFKHAFMKGALPQNSFHHKMDTFKSFIRRLFLIDCI